MWALQWVGALVRHQRGESKVEANNRKQVRAVERQCDRSDRDCVRPGLRQIWGIMKAARGQKRPRASRTSFSTLSGWRKRWWATAMPLHSQGAGWSGREWMWNFYHPSVFVILVAPKSKALPALSRAMLWQAEELPAVKVFKWERHLEYSAIWICTCIFIISCIWMQSQIINIYVTCNIHVCSWRWSYFSTVRGNKTHYNPLEFIWFAQNSECCFVGRVLWQGHQFCANKFVRKVAKL